MNWKSQLKKLEDKKQWDEAIEFMLGILDEHQDSLDAYLFMNYLLMNLLVEEEYDRTKYDYYQTLLKIFFDESYEKYCDNAEYLYYTGMTAVMSPWYFGIDIDDWKLMLQKAMDLDPENPLYIENYYLWLDKSTVQNQEAATEYAKLVLADNSPIKKILNNKGSMGEYLLRLSEEWATDILNKKFAYR